MSSDRDERVQDWLNDIVENSDRIASYIDGFDYEQFIADQKSRDASERCLERIIEACVRLGPERLAAIADGHVLHKIRGLGNVLRHAYETVDTKFIWDTIIRDVPALCAACERALAAGGK